jgi:hypothetical protein
LSSIETFQFSLRRVDGASETVDVRSDRVLLGSGSHCELRVGPEEGAPEHVVFQARAGAVFAQARALDPAPTLNGVPFTEGRILPDSWLQIGGLAVAVRLAQGLAHESQAKVDRGRSPVPSLIGLALIAVLGTYVLWPSAPDSGLTATGAPPALWDGPRATCSQTEPSAALARAQEDAQVADSKRERAPFYPRDGVAAVRLYESAAACFGAGGAQPDAASAASAAERLRRHLADDFHVHTVRLERFLALKEYDSAQHEVRTLLQFLQGKSGEYVTWLGAVDRKISMKFAGNKGEGS